LVFLENAFHVLTHRFKKVAVKACPNELL
jgi:hypothetical protein